MMYHVKYVEGCSCKLRSFISKEAATKFVANFMLKHQNTRCQEDNWIDMVFKGELIYLEPATPHLGKINISAED